MELWIVHSIHVRNFVSLINGFSGHIASGIMRGLEGECLRFMRSVDGSMRNTWCSMG